MRRKFVIYISFSFLFFSLILLLRDWFVLQKTENDLLKLELIAERKLRKQLEQKLEQAEQAKRSVERERDLFRVRTRINSFVMQ
jgi:hypothetical protein